MQVKTQTAKQNLVQLPAWHILANKYHSLCWWIHSFINLRSYGCLDTSKDDANPLSCCDLCSNDETIAQTVVVAFTTSRYLIFMSCISHFSLPNPFHEPCSQTMNQTSPPSPPLPLPPCTPLSPLPPPAPACQNICEILFSFNKV